MKRILLITMVCLLLSGCGIYNLDNFVTPNDTEFMAVVESLDTPEKIGDYMMENFIYKAYDFTALSPYELFIYKKGDCDIFAKFGVFIADYHGYGTFTIQIFDGGFYSHYVAVYNEDIWYSITDGRYYSFGYDDFKEIVNVACQRRNKEWTKYIVYDYWNNIIEEVNNGRIN